MSNSTEETLARYTIKASVFTDLFTISKYLLQMYQVLHPEDTTVTEDDLTDVTHENILIDQQYNDLSFSKGNQKIILMEAQSTWTMNILIRAFLYLAQAYQEYITKNQLDAYDSKKIPLPMPELYVLYTGTRKKRPAVIRLSEEFFDGKPTDLDVTIHMLYGTDSNDIISQYVKFTRIYDKQRALHGRTRKAVSETIRICKESNILREYLEEREQEVSNIMMTLFDEETIRKNHEASVAREYFEKGVERGIQSVVKLCQSMGGSRLDAIENVIRDFDLKESDAIKKVDLYWK